MVRPCPCPSCPVKKRSCLASADVVGGRVRYCTLTSTHFFFASGLGVDDASLRSGVGYNDDVSPADHGILLAGGPSPAPAPARRGPNSLAGSWRRLQSAATMGCVCGTPPPPPRACVIRFGPLSLQDAAAAARGDGTRRAILEVTPVVSLDAIRLEPLPVMIREDGRGLGSIDLRCWREVDDERVICV